ncbi:MAG: hypothetical protein ABIX01_21600 [Chitinophagaceae bacterium]
MSEEFNFQHGDIAGAIAVKMANNQNLDDLCQHYVAEYNRDRFEAIAIRVFAGKETIITLYALDKLRQEDQAGNPDRLPVKKFKLTNVPAAALFSFCESFNFTLSTGVHHIEDMEVVNK